MEKIWKMLKKYKIHSLCIIIIILSIGNIIYQKLQKSYINNLDIDSKNNEYISVYITGAVKNEGMYNLKKGEGMQELLNVCGGVLEQADIEKIDFDRDIINGDKINILKKQEEMEEEYQEEYESDKININKASKEELMTLVGIGDVSAKNIIEYRENNMFIDIEDIMNVKGIGSSKFEKIKDKIEV